MFQHAAARRRLTANAGKILIINNVSTRSRPKAADSISARPRTKVLFQHAAARRRLIVATLRPRWIVLVSTRSRPKAAEV